MIPDIIMFVNPETGECRLHVEGTEPQSLDGPWNRIGRVEFGLAVEIGAREKRPEIEQ